MSLFSMTYPILSTAKQLSVRLGGLTVRSVAIRSVAIRSVAIGAILSSSIILIPSLASATMLDRRDSSVETPIAQSRAIPATSAQSETLYLNRDRTYNYNLVVAEGISVDGLYIPAGSTIEGRYEPAEDGLQYVARAVQVDGQRYSLNAVSNVLEDRRDPRDTRVGSIAEDAGIGAAGGAALGEIFGAIDVGEVLGGAAAGVVVGNLTADQVVVIEPDQPITLYSR